MELAPAEWVMVWLFAGGGWRGCVVKASGRGNRRCTLKSVPREPVVCDKELWVANSAIATVTNFYGIRTASRGSKA